MKKVLSWILLWLLCSLASVASLFVMPASAVIGSGRKARRLAVAYDQLGNAATGGDEDETISSRCWRYRDRQRRNAVMSDKSNILNKVKKCLALAKSGNEHEAAAAMRQAQKLMREHGITDDAVMAASASEADARAGAFARPSSWECDLAICVGEAFGCETLFVRNYTVPSTWRFIGCGASPQVAQYAFQVLYRQAKKARADYIKTQLKRVKKSSVRTRRADLFSNGWVRTAVHSIPSWGCSATAAAAIQAHKRIRYKNTSDLKSTDRNADRKLRDHEWDDYSAGQESGLNAEVNRGVGADAAPAMLEG